MAAYATVTEMRQQMNKTDVTDDGQLAQLLDAATLAINNFCNRPDGFLADSTASARLYIGSGRGWLRIDECVAVTMVQVKPSSLAAYTTWSATDYLTCSGDERFPNYNPVAQHLPITALKVDPGGDHAVFYRDGVYPTVQVTARWGFSELTPPTIKEACIMQSVRWHKRLQGAMSDATASMELGQIWVKGLDPAVQSLLVTGRYAIPTI